MRIDLGQRARRVLDARAASVVKPEPVQEYVASLMRLAL